MRVHYSDSCIGLMAVTWYEPVSSKSKVYLLSTSVDIINIYLHPAQLVVFLPIPTSLDLFYGIIFVLRHKSISIVFANFDCNLKLLGVTVELLSLNTMTTAPKPLLIPLNCYRSWRLYSQTVIDIHSQCTVTCPKLTRLTQILLDLA